MKSRNGIFFVGKWFDICLLTFNVWRKPSDFTFFSLIIFWHLLNIQRKKCDKIFSNFFAKNFVSILKLTKKDFIFLRWSAINSSTSEVLTRLLSPFLWLVVNFINILPSHFLYESLFGSFSLVTLIRKKLPERLLYKKWVQKM